MEGSPGAETFLTVADVAELLKLNQQTVRNWIDQGSLPALRVGRRVRIRRTDLDRLLESGSTIGGGAAGPSADDFWGGTPVGLAELDPDAEPLGNRDLSSDAGLSAVGPLGDEELGGEEDDDTEPDGDEGGGGG
jgi:excisionase family DNA binding protein